MTCFCSPLILKTLQLLLNKMGLRKFLRLKNKDREQQEPQTQPSQGNTTPEKQTNETPVNQLPISHPATKDDKGTETTAQQTVPKDQAQIPESPVDTLARSVWNRAYDELASDGETKELVEAYMKAIRQASKPDGNTDPDAADQDVAEIKDQAQRDEILKNAIKSGQERIQKSIGTSAASQIGKASEFVLKFKDITDLAVGTNPQAALPWAGVCIGLTVSSYAI